EIVRRGVDQARAGHHRRGLGQPGREPEALHFPLHLIAGAGAAVIAVKGRRLQEKGFHHRGSPLAQSGRGTSGRQTWDIAPEGSTANSVPRQCTRSPNSEATKTAKLNRSRRGRSQKGPAYVPKSQSIRAFRNMREAR